MYWYPFFDVQNHLRGLNNENRYGSCKKRHG
jgi:hypothetical protein